MVGRDSLRFRTDGTFTIAQFTDMHIHDDEETNRRTLRLVERVMDDVKPDLVVLTGDIIYGADCTSPAEAYLSAVSLFERRGVPWCAVFGNHDDEGSMSRRELMELWNTCSYNLSEPGPEEVSGVGNYYRLIKGAKVDEPKAILYFLDSQSYGTEEIGGWGWLKPDQVHWYYQTAQKLNQGRDIPLPALAFFHIPLPEYELVWQLGNCEGSKHEEICCPKLNTGMFAAMCEAGDVIGVFVGHDHINDFIGELYGIYLGYGRGTGYGTYGKQGFARGARIIRLYEDKREFSTWVVLDE